MHDISHGKINYNVIASRYINFLDDQKALHKHCPLLPPPTPKLKELIEQIQITV
jgi:hypothetical protein